MGMRLLTTKFTSYNIAKMEKEHNKDLMDFVDIGNLSVNKLLLLVSMGSNRVDLETAGQRLDNYLSDENNSLVDAYLQVLEELDMDTKILKRSGIKISDIKQRFEKNIKENTEIKALVDDIDETDEVEPAE